MSLFPKVELQSINVDEGGACNFFDGALKASFVVPDGEGSSTLRQIYKANNPHTGAGRKSTATPPCHWHIYQTETFKVASGVLCYYINGKEGKLNAGESVTILPGEHHTFWSDETTGEDLEVYITSEGGPNPGFDEKFMRNFYGYVSSCKKQDTTPNLFQMLAFLDSADIVLTDFPLGLGRLANVVLGRWIGRLIGGYQVEYKVFEKKAD